MNFTSRPADSEGNLPIAGDHVTKLRYKRDRFHQQIVRSLDEMKMAAQDESPIYKYMRYKQCSPETIDEICRQTHVEMGYVMQWLETMVFEGLVERQVTCGVSRYVLADGGKVADSRPGISVTSRHTNQAVEDSKTSDMNGNEKPESVDDTYTEDSNASTEELEQHLEEGCWVLVTGCDSGEFIAGLAKKFPHTSFIALHNNRKSLVNMMEMCLQAEVYNVNFQEGEPDLLPNSWIQCFDWAILYDVIHGVPDVRATLQNARRVLKKSGVLSLTFKPEKTQMKDDDLKNDNALKEEQTEKALDRINGETKTNDEHVPLTAEFVKELIGDTKLEIIRSDAMNSNEERMHIMCAVSDLGI